MILGPRGGHRGGDPQGPPPGRQERCSSSSRSRRTARTNPVTWWPWIPSAPGRASASSPSPAARRAWPRAARTRPSIPPSSASWTTCNWSGSMYLGRVIGCVWSTAKHPGLHGRRLLIVQPITPDAPGLRPPPSSARTGPAPGPAKPSTGAAAKSPPSPSCRIRCPPTSASSALSIPSTPPALRRSRADRARRGGPHGHT